MHHFAGITALATMWFVFCMVAILLIVVSREK